MNSLTRTISLYYHTLRYLTLRQIYFQIVYRVKKTFFRKQPKIVAGSIEVQSLRFTLSIPSKKSYLGNGVFDFLNKQKEFGAQIDWNFIEFEKDRKSVV